MTLKLNLVSISEQQDTLMKIDARSDIEVALAPKDGLQDFNNVIGIDHINALGVLISEISPPRLSDFAGQLRFIFDLKITDVDIGFIGLIAHAKINIPGLHVIITLPTYRDGEVFARFRDILLTTRSWFQSISRIRLFDITNEHLIDKQKVKEPEGLFPVIPIDPERFELFFNTNLTPLSFSSLFASYNRRDLYNGIKHSIEAIPDEAKTAGYAEFNYRVLRSVLRENEHKISWGAGNRMIYRPVLRILSEFDLIPEQLQSIHTAFDRLPLMHGKKRGSEKNMLQLKAAWRELIDRLEQQSPYFVLLFCVLVNRNLEKSINSTKQYLAQLNELFEFSQNLFLGIKELARNIVEHTDSKKGVLTGRIYNGSALLELKRKGNSGQDDDGMPGYFGYLQSAGLMKKSPEKELFLDLILFDEGKVGIVNKTISNISSLSDSDMENDLYKKDITALKSGGIAFKDFFNTEEMKLNHHAVKASSHWGLIIFTNLIKKNNGFFSVSSVSGKPDQIDQCVVYGKQLSSPASVPAQDCFQMGSIYNIILPLNKSKNLKDHYLPNVAPRENIHAAEAYNKLLEYRFIPNPDSRGDIDNKSLLNIIVKSFMEEISEGYHIEVIIATRIAQFIKGLRAKYTFAVPVLDFDGCGNFFDQSKFFRLIGKIESEINIYSLIVTNIENRILKTLFETLSRSLTREDHFDVMRPFWNSDHFILVYSYVVKADNRLYFTDILGGYNYLDHVILQQKLAASHFTYAAKEKTVKDAEFSSKTREGLDNSPLYITNSGLIQNFELIIKHRNKTLFEHSMEYILNEEVE